MDWARLRAHLTGTVDQEWLLLNEWLLAENRILKPTSRAGCSVAMLKGPLWLAGGADLASIELREHPTR